MSLPILLGSDEKEIIFREVKKNVKSDKVLVVGIGADRVRLIKGILEIKPFFLPQDGKALDRVIESAQEEELKAIGKKFGKKPPASAVFSGCDWAVAWALQKGIRIAPVGFTNEQAIRRTFITVGHIAKRIPKEKSGMVSLLKAIYSGSIRVGLLAQEKYLLRGLSKIRPEDIGMIAVDPVFAPAIRKVIKTKSVYPISARFIARTPLRMIMKFGAQIAKKKIQQGRNARVRARKQ